MHRQQLLEGVNKADLNAYLDKGARVVWISPATHDSYRVVIETVKELEFTREQAVMEFLGSIDTRALESELLDRDMDVSMGEAIQLTLGKWVVDGTA